MKNNPRVLRDIIDARIYSRQYCRFCIIESVERRIENRVIHEVDREVAEYDSCHNIRRRLRKTLERKCNLRDLHNSYVLHQARSALF